MGRRARISKGAAVQRAPEGRPSAETVANLKIAKALLVVVGPEVITVSGLTT